jgi:hypothetical protein
MAWPVGGGQGVGQEGGPARRRAGACRGLELGGAGANGRVHGPAMRTAEGLRGIQPDLDASGDCGVRRLTRNQAVAEAFGQSPGQVADAAQHPLTVAAQQAATFDQLQDHVGNLQQHVVILDLPLTGAVDMLQIEPAVLLDVEALRKSGNLGTPYRLNCSREALRPRWTAPPSTQTPTCPTRGATARTARPRNTPAWKKWLFFTLADRFPVIPDAA